jgi:hypothetical protein
MPTIFRQQGFNVRIYPNDHSPPHVHVIKDCGQAKIELGEGGQEPRLLLVQGMSQKEANQALNLVKERSDLFLQKWREIHGER